MISCSYIAFYQSRSNWVRSMEKVDFYEVLLALSSAIDLAEDSGNYNKDTGNRHRFQNHSRRTCYVAVNIAKSLSESKEFYEKVYIASIIHDIGITQNIKISHISNVEISKHCIHGYELAKRLPINSQVPEIIKYHHENYDGSQNYDLKGEEIPLISQILRIADEFELAYDEHIPNYLQRDNIIEYLKNNKNKKFSPAIVEKFMEVQSKDVFWWDVENIGSNFDIMLKIKPNLVKDITLGELKNIAVVFADIIDSRSSFTYKHSLRLSKLVLKASDYLGYGSIKKERLEIAALLHDIGKLAVPNTILNKNGKLDKTERLIMNSHTYYTRTILSKIQGFEDITEWAANHHEKLNGSGYPLGISALRLSKEERLMAVLDIYEALTADRPYKQGLSKAESLAILNDMETRGELCKECIDILHKIDV